MIAFDLQCEKGHAFEGWFEDSHAYDSQKKKGLITCPSCNSTAISKLPSTFAIKGSQALTNPMDKQIDLKRISNEISEYVNKSFDNVGCEFAKEALKMHYGVTESRNIRGVSTKEEEKILSKEGIQFFKVPVAVPADPDSEDS
jgi:hypothetical protein